MTIYTIYSSEEEKKALHAVGADSFETMWRLKTNCFETPNKRRNGWSSVIAWPENNPQWFIKRQENHNTRTLFHPFSGMPTYRRELKNTIKLHQAGITVLHISFYGERVVNKKHQAILTTRVLTDYQDLYTWYKSNQENEALVMIIMQKIGKIIRDMHDKGWFHYCLYPNHIFVKANIRDNADICFIDLEKARRRIPLNTERIKELKCFMRHATHTFAAKHLKYLIESYVEHPPFYCFGLKKIISELFFY